MIPGETDDRIACIGLLLVSVIFMGKAWIGGHFKSVDALRSYLESYGVWGPIVLMAIQALQVVLPVLPGMFGCVVGAAMFGAAGGFWINYIGISAGSLLAYWLGVHDHIRDQHITDLRIRSALLFKIRLHFFFLP